MAFEADKFKGLRTEAVLRSANVGDPPFIYKPKRKRAYHRALKRDEAWATRKKVFNDAANTINRVLQRQFESLDFFGLYRGTIGLAQWLPDEENDEKE